MTGSSVLPDTLIVVMVKSHLNFPSAFNSCLHCFHSQLDVPQCTITGISKAMVCGALSMGHCT